MGWGWRSLPSVERTGSKRCLALPGARNTVSGDLGLESGAGPGKPRNNPCPEVLFRGISLKCLRDSRDFLEILLSGDTSIQELNCALKRSFLTSDRPVRARLGR